MLVVLIRQVHKDMTQLGQLAINTTREQAIISNDKKQIKVNCSHLRQYVIESYQYIFKLSLSIFIMIFFETFAILWNLSCNIMYSSFMNFFIMHRYNTINKSECAKVDIMKQKFPYRLHIQKVAKN